MLSTTLMHRRAGVVSHRVILISAMTVLLSACAAPGMRMDSQTQFPLSEASDRAMASTSAQVPIREINVALIQQLRRQAEQEGAARGLDLFAAPQPYTLGPGDVLQITVWDHPELAAAQGAQSQAQARPADAPAGFVVGQSGEIQFPYAGVLNVTGLRADQVQVRLVQRLSTVYRNPQVTVRIASFRAKKVYIDGEVHTPGVQIVNDIPMTLYEAINRAGGFAPTADQSRMVLVRDGVAHPVDLSQMLAHRQNPSRILLRDGDVLRVVSRDENGVFVMGEVNRPATAVPLKTGRLNLSDALSQAGSLNVTSANAAQMYVIRGATAGTPHVYHLDAHSPVAMLLANQFELQPKDIVYVDSTGLARFSRVLSQLLPLINAGLTGAVLAK